MTVLGLLTQLHASPGEARRDLAKCEKTEQHTDAIINAVMGRLKTQVYLTFIVPGCPLRSDSATTIIQ